MNLKFTIVYEKLPTRKPPPISLKWWNSLHSSDFCYWLWPLISISAKLAQYVIIMPFLKKDVPQVMKSTYFGEFHISDSGGFAVNMLLW